MGYYINPDKTLIMEPYDATGDYDLVEDDGITEDDYIAELTVFEWDNDHKAWRHLSDLPSEWGPHITPKGDDHPGIPAMMEWHQGKAPIGSDIIDIDNGDALYPPTYN